MTNVNISLIEGGAVDQFWDLVWSFLTRYLCIGWASSLVDSCGATISNQSSFCWYEQYCTVHIFRIFSHLLVNCAPLQPQYMTLANAPDYILNLFEAFLTFFDILLLFLMISDNFTWFLTFYNCNLMLISLSSITTIYLKPSNAPLHPADHFRSYSNYFTHLTLFQCSQVLPH